MNNFMNNLRMKFAQFMQGRYGADQLNLAMIWTAVIGTLIGSIFGLRIIVLMSDALLLLGLFRMFSRNRAARAAENAKYLTKTYGARKAASEWLIRMKNRKQFCYFRCPKCKKLVRVPRGKGKVTITCRDCGTKFDKKA